MPSILDETHQLRVTRWGYPKQRMLTAAARPPTQVVLRFVHDESQPDGEYLRLSFRKIKLQLEIFISMVNWIHNTQFSERRESSPVKADLRRSESSQSRFRLSRPLSSWNNESYTWSARGIPRYVLENSKTGILQHTFLLETKHIQDTPSAPVASQLSLISEWTPIGRTRTTPRCAILIHIYSNWMIGGKGTGGDYYYVIFIGRLRIPRRSAGNAIRAHLLHQTVPGLSTGVSLLTDWPVWWP